MGNRLTINILACLMLCLFGSSMACQANDLKAIELPSFNISANQTTSKPNSIIEFSSKQLIIKDDSFSLSIPEENGKPIHHSESWEISFILISPDSGDIEIAENDQLIIESRLDVAFIMGIRLLFVN